MRAEEGGLGGELARDPQDARLVVDVEPVAALDLDGGGAERAHLGDEPARALARSSSSLAARVAATVVAMPPPV